ncbi:hypothetical protein CAPTEDRAFT_212283 [Capitella teleta]|uniref:SCP2 domain-containing protein n=1 Tax=Capitella teleta TaxID=283909 RepID=R7UBB4_CAPTE|nr:hypothetical protein CAPTEDRAFT_212283 [Capitella teleta]|eukprot:ELU03279.1 hypothetical protein CAPTEDRAFT_212283 [Capitella teleta]
MAQPKDFRVSVLFEILEGQLKQSGKPFVDKVKGTFCFKIKKDGKMGVWVVDMKNGSGSVKYDPKGKAEVTITIDDEDFIKLLTNELNPQQAFFQGKMKLAGNLGLAMRMKALESQLRPKL